MLACLLAPESEGAGGSATITTTLPSGPPEQPRRRVRDKCAPELGLVRENEKAATYARSPRVFCNTSSPWAEQHVGQLPRVFGLVLPWHDQGYRSTNYFRKKLSAVSPLWYRALPDRNGSYELVGQEFANRQRRWSEQTSAPACQAGRGCVPGPAVVPTVSLEGFESIADIRSVLESPAKFALEVALVCETYGHAGIVLDVRLALFSRLKPLLPAFVAKVAQALHSDGRQLLLSVPGMPPTGKGPDFDRQDAAAVSAVVDGVIVGTRDFSKAEPGPSAPLPWVQACLTRLLATEGEPGLRPEQLLLEVQTYGRAFQEGSDEGKVILGKESVKVIANLKPKVTWDAESAEHFANVSSKRLYIAVPTLKFVEARLLLARKLGVGVAIRELGAEFDAALDLLPHRRQAGAVDDRAARDGGGEAPEGARDNKPPAAEL